MGERIVFLTGIQDLRDGLICGELYGGERDGHGKGGRIGNVKSPKTFVTKDGFGALID